MKKPEKNLVNNMKKLTTVNVTNKTGIQFHLSFYSTGYYTKR